MKKSIIYFFILIMLVLIPCTIAEDNANSNPTNGNGQGQIVSIQQVSTDVNNSNELTISNELINSNRLIDAIQNRTKLQIKNGAKQLIKEQIKARNVSELKKIIKEKQSKLGNISRNQNRIRLAVHALLAMENITGGIGPQVSEIAREFNNSMQATIKSEEKIQARNQIVRFFAGGDYKAAQEIEQEINQSRVKVQELKRLREECNCTDEVKAMMQEQIQNMEQEQSRLSELAEQEKQNKGLFGWLWK